MFSLFAKLIKDNKNYKNPKVREGYGILSGIMGIALNILLFIGKLFAGIFTGAISVTADAFNNLTDAGSSLITFIGFRLSARPTDKKHPFGHGRMEYIAGFIVSMLIFLVGFELIKSSIEELISPSDLQFSYVVIGILIASVLVKGYMFFYNYVTAKKINSSAMRATAYDCISDSVSTLVVIISLVINKVWGWRIDGVTGILVALFILFSGYQAARETINLLLGEAPEREYVEDIEKTVLAQEGIIGVHDLMVHNYGPGRQIISMHAEVDSRENVNIAHDHVDNAEQALTEKFGCIAVLHTDPIVVDDPKVDELKRVAEEAVKKVDPSFTIHDFRVTVGDHHTNLIFDITVPHDTKFTASQIEKEVSENVKNINKSYNVVCKSEHSFIGLN